MNPPALTVQPHRGKFQAVLHALSIGIFLSVAAFAGDIRVRGSIVGRIEANGDVRDRGSIVGRAEGMTKEQAAVLFFFGFFAVR